jgi:hypothetical protein
MTSRSGRGRLQRVLDARRQARAGLGRGPADSDLFAAPPKARKALPPPPAPAPVQGSPGIGVLSLGEAAGRLGITRAELETMIDSAKVVTLPVGDVGRVVPTSEVERLRGDR